MNCPWDTAIDADPSPAVRPRLIHVSDGAAVHVQPAEVVIVSEKPVPCQCSVNSNGDTEYSQFVGGGGGGGGVAPACRTTNAWPATAIVVCRLDEAVWADTEKVTVPFPVPTEPDPMESQASDDEEVHEQPAPAVTVIAPVPPVEAKS